MLASWLRAHSRLRVPVRPLIMAPKRAAATSKEQAPAKRTRAQKDDTKAAAKEEQEEKPKRAAGSSKEEAPAKRTRAQKEEPKAAAKDEQEEKPKRGRGRPRKDEAGPSSPAKSKPAASKDTGQADKKPAKAKAKPKGKGPQLVESAVDLSDGKRDKNGLLSFPGFPEFKPNLTPKQVIQAHSFGGIYFNPKGGKPSDTYPKAKGGVPIDHKEFPEDWFEGLDEEFYNATRYIAKRNKYGVKAGQAQADWEAKGWIKEQDPRGWFHWYCRFYQGRRTDDDERQIGRWKGVAGLKGRWKRSLVNKILAKGTAYNDASVSPVVRQSLLHWAYELTEPHFEQMAKQVQR